MPIDFRATNIQTQKLIASGSIASSGRSQIAIYPIESQDPGTPHQGVILPEVLENIVSTDIFFYVSGAIGSKGGSTHGAAVFGGDLHISGNLTVDGTSPGGGGGGDSYWTLDVSDQIYTTSSVLINNTMFLSGNVFSAGSAPDKIDMTIQGYNAGSASGDDGVNLFLFGGGNDQDSSNGGGVLVQGGAATTAGNGGSASVLGGTSENAGSEGGSTFVQGGDHQGNSLSAGSGGSVYIAGGYGYASGGVVYIQAGASYGGDGAGVVIAASDGSGDQVESNKNGGNISFATGNGFDGGNGGDLTIILGSGENTNRTIAGGSLFVSGGISTAGPGGSLNFQAGGDDGQVPSVGGDTIISAGSSLNGIGGGVQILAGTGSSDSGDVYVYSRNFEVTASQANFSGKIGVGRTASSVDPNNAIAMPYANLLVSRDSADSTDVNLIRLGTSFFGDTESISIGDGTVTSIFLIPGAGTVVGTVKDSGSMVYSAHGFSITSDLNTVFPSSVGSDVFFFVSGTMGSRGTSNRGTVAFGGDLHISGNLSVDGTVLVNPTSGSTSRDLNDGDAGKVVFFDTTSAITLITSGSTLSTGWSTLLVREGASSLIISGTAATTLVGPAVTAGVVEITANYGAVSMVKRSDAIVWCAGVTS